MKSLHDDNDDAILFVLQAAQKGVVVPVIDCNLNQPTISSRPATEILGPSIARYATNPSGAKDRAAHTY